jgi:hypothetical protein
MKRIPTILNANMVAVMTTAMVMTLIMTMALTFIIVPATTVCAQQTQSYVVQQGDTARSIAKQFYGKANLGSRLLTANRNFLANPKKLTPGEKIYLFPESTLNLRKPVEMPPLPELAAETLYETNKLLNKSFPKYMTFMADVRGLGGSGVWRIRVNRMAPNSRDEQSEHIDRYFEVRPVGEIISSSELGSTKIFKDGFSMTDYGRTLLSTGDNVIVRFTNDLAKILDSDTYDESDPYFRTFPVYSIGNAVHEPDKNSPNYSKPLGNLIRYKGNITIGARVEGSVPPSSFVSNRTKNTARVDQNNDLDPVTYVANIVYVEDPIEVSDKILVFVPLDPGPERRLDSPYVEPPDTYVSPGR